jgi:maltooligosyltrehalose trehalohydrolase
MEKKLPVRRLPIGAEIQEDGGVHFRVWAPESKTVAVEEASIANGANGAKTGAASLNALASEGNGYFSGLVPALSEGSLYKLKLDSGSFPDPASRLQPEGPHGPSQVVSARRFKWTDSAWKGLPPGEWVIYEMHIGTFTPEGTWRAAMEQLKELQALGITVLEVMPVADFPGKFGWGYDGVNLFAPTRLYGSPDDARAFVNHAHSLGMMVILDVVYNHVGPDGNYLKEFSKDYFSSKYKCEWGEALNFDGENSGPVREFFISNARFWIEEYHFDGLRLDATQQIFDSSKEHVILKISEAARAAGKAQGKRICLVGENEPQHPRLARTPENGGYGLDALWNDDYHHSAIVAACGRKEAYYSDYRGTPQEFISAAKYGFLFQGQWYLWQKHRRGTPALDLSAQNFVVFLQNHDQIANSLRGERLNRLTDRAKLRALTAVTLLNPSIPMLFQGEEFAASAPFLFFADHNPELNKLVKKGRREFLCQFRSIASPECEPVLASPGAEETFLRCKLDLTEREKNAPVYQLHRDLLRLRREDLTIHSPETVDGAVLSAEAFVLRYFSATGDDRLLLVNLGRDIDLNPAPEPLLAPIKNHGWRVLWSSESTVYGGNSTPPMETKANWMLPAHCAVVMEPDENAELPSVRLSQED